MATDFEIASQGNHMTPLPMSLFIELVLMANLTRFEHGSFEENRFCLELSLCLYPSLIMAPTFNPAAVGKPLFSTGSSGRLGGALLGGSGDLLSSYFIEL